MKLLRFFKKSNKYIESEERECQDAVSQYPKVTYDFPKDGHNPFDLDVQDRYFIQASGLTNLSDEIEDFKIVSFRGHIPGGYKTVIVLQRVLIIRDGESIREWEYDKNLRSYKESLLGGYITEFVGGFCLISNLGRPLFGNIEESKTYSIPKPDSDKTSKQAHVWKVKDEAVKYASDLSIENNETIIVAQIIEDICWH